MNFRRRNTSGFASMTDESKINVIHVSEHKGPAIAMHVRITTTGGGRRQRSKHRKGKEQGLKETVNTDG